MKTTTRISRSFRFFILHSSFFILALPALAADTQTYVLGVPPAPTIYISSNSSDNPWLVENNAYPAMSVAATTGGVSRVEVLDQPQITLTSAEAGFPLERAKPDYYLADIIEPPEDVDWSATYTAFLALPDEERAAFIFDKDNHRLFAAQGGTVNFSWHLADGTVRLMTYSVSLACSGRPRRIYWTDYPYNSPGINLSGKFVKFFGSEEILTPRYGSVTNIAAGIQQVVTNKIVSGLSVDPATDVLYAYGQLQGQVVMAYYDTGTFERLLHVQAVEVCRPQVNRLTGEIGRALTPNGRAGYSQTGLRARPNYVQPSDNRGDWYYQHQGQYSYSPKHGNVYPLRPTKDCPWNMAVYWMETDEMEVDWPFELDQYECDWPADATVFVRGDVDGQETDATASAGRPIYVPTAYTATLMAYQEPEGHAHAVAMDGTFTTFGEGYSLLKLTADDNVWFLPIQSVLRSNTNYFTLAAEDIRVGYEVKMRGGSVAGTTPGFSPKCDPTSPGSIYEAVSAPVWNPDIYVAAKPYGAADVSTDIPETTADTNKYESVIFAVSARNTSDGERPTIEVWWNTTIQEDGMQEALTIPTLPQVYAIRWPDAGETPQIVLASQLGSASESIFSHNMGLYLSDTDSNVEIPPRKYFDENDGGTVMFWVKADAEVAADAPVAAILSDTLAPLASVSGDLVPLADPGVWHHVAATFMPSGSLCVYVDGVQKRLSGASVTSDDLAGDWTVGLGRISPTAAVTPGLTFGEILMWNRALSAEEVGIERLKTHTGPENHLTGCYSFIDMKDLAVTGTDRRTFTDKVLGTVCSAYKCLAEENGPPALGTGLIVPDSGRIPKVYVQNDSVKDGYNPNEEHAIVRTTSDGAYEAWALRTDLNSDDSSAPGVLVEYVKDGRKTMQWFDVVVTNSVYPELAAACVAGKAFPGPHPIDFFDDPWCPEDSWDEPVSSAPAFRDRKGQLWARAAGTATMRLYYRMQDGFAFPSIDQANWPSIGTAIPWLALLGGDPTSSSVLTAKPAPWVWRVTWPDEVPEMEIGRTLTLSSSGLPEVWNGKSVGVVWPATDAERDATAVLFDPTVAQTSGFPKSTYQTIADAIADLGIKQGAGGNGTLRKGRWTFDGLPPSISKRFYLDTTADITQCLKLEGEMEDNSAGVSLLHVNVLNKEERDILSSLLDNTASPAGKAAWRTAIAALATSCVKPSPHTTVSTVEDRINYTPRDHYALFTMGATNYITLIENDTTNALMNVAAGDPISMHLVKVVPKYYTGPVVTREDPINLLSQQLSVIYGEAFAGEPEQYVFEWKKCRPHADGSVPTDFEDEYTAKFDLTAGLTRFVIGGQGDTLANMVNTYYAVRYRAASESSPAYAAMGDRWSDWSEPALAEGWVQRVLNNVTPFAQRMRDLVENEAETPVSMIRQAGKPYEGDVALNQDNLTSVGLIQLYETILSKAESMSLQMEIDDPDANKQLQLAVTRLADLYNVLGDEAWTDALNPTIGFGSNFDNTEMTGFELDYGALSTSLFAFDNQVPTLLDEELALLRGRSGDNAPSTHISPYYNRLVWNFTKGLTAGEVAYAVNYDISGNNKGIIDENDAADMFPQGHGDAYGHYLSALSGYYRLLRNPYFTWGEPAMGEMVVADAVLNVDYYDEAQFAKAAYNVAKVAAETVDRTARKAYRDNGGETGAGYLDSDKTRNFGYGEWASRGGYGALCNWAVGNALLSEQPKSGKYWRYRFANADDGIWRFAADTDDEAYARLDADGNWTIEFQLVPAAERPEDAEEDENANALLIIGETDAISFELTDGNTLAFSRMNVEMETVTNTVYHYTYTNVAESAASDAQAALTVTNGTKILECVFFGTNNIPTALPLGYNMTEQLAEGTDTVPAAPEWDGWLCTKWQDVETGEFIPFVYQSEAPKHGTSDDGIETFEIGQVAANGNTLVALRSNGGVPTVTLFDASGAKIAEKAVGGALELETWYVQLGGNYAGEIGEFRVWDSVLRTDAELLAKRDFVSPLTSGLAFYLRPIYDSEAAPEQLIDETNSLTVWEIDGGEWIVANESGMSIEFEDEGLKRIDRSTVTELSSLASMIPDIQKRVDRMDAGLSPLGLSSGAIPFDLTPIAPGEDGLSHYEQIRERAGTALANAKKLLDKAQIEGGRIRMIQESQFSRENQLETMELETKNRLIEYFGYPYEGDIGPGGTYPQGYDGPDLLNYAWMEPQRYGLSANEDIQSVATNIYVRDGSKFRDGGTILIGNFGLTNDFMTISYEKSATGIILKPANITGRRRAQGQIQEKMGDLLNAYRNLKSRIMLWELANSNFEYQYTVVNRSAAIYAVKKALDTVKYGYDMYASAMESVLKIGINSMEHLLSMEAGMKQGILEAAPEIIGAGMTVNTDPSAMVSAAIEPVSQATRNTLAGTLLAAKNELVAQDAIAQTLDIAGELLDITTDFIDTYAGYYDTIIGAAGEVFDAARECKDAYVELMAAEAALETVVAEAERIIDERTLARQQAVDNLTKARYNEMFFRLARNNALSRYNAQFELAQKYTYLAAQAYDYETGLLSIDRVSGEQFMARIVGARTIGEFDDDGEPIVASDAAKGDGGLAAILAELDANWLVLKPRLGINNPQPYATWFSLRHDLFRIYDDEAGDKAWRTELRKYLVEDLNAVPEFRHYCQPLAGSTAEKEPGLVIPFGSVIAHGYNFFGQELVGGDSSLDPTYYATHISSAGIHFEGFDDSVLAKTPSVYLVPVGEDRMRAVGDPETVISWKVVDQTIPAPYAIGSAKLDDPDWTPLYDGNTGGNDLGARIRKHPSFRVYYDDEGKEPSDDALDCTRLVGRSAWNTRWLLIIPAGTLGADREEALSAFINGIDSDRDGCLDFQGVSDIKIGLKTYSTSGN
ncbi:MAG: hypothetical protein IJU44_11895 [Kiritimatiellae bacterium]|nr:hypothetical protein [Kiritimatiellia bacterium]